MIKQHLLPRPPLIPNPKNEVEKIKKTIPNIQKPANIYNNKTNYAMNLLTNRRTGSRFKDPFSR